MRSRRGESGAPQHKCIQDNIVNDIIRGTYKKGVMIPNQTELAEKYGVSRTTIRKATDKLIQNGILRSIKGVGTFVCDYDENIHQIYRSTSCAEAQCLRNYLTSKTITIQKMNATKAISKQLNIQIGEPVVYIERIRLLAGRPFAFQVSYLNGTRVEGVPFTKELLDHGSLFHALEEYAGMRPAFQDEEFRAIGCPKAIADYLEIDAQSPVIMIFRTVYTEENTVMEYCEDYESTDYKGVLIRTYARSEYERRGDS